MVVEKPVKESIVVSVDDVDGFRYQPLGTNDITGELQLGDPHWIGMLENAGSPHGQTILLVAGLLWRLL